MICDFTETLKSVEAIVLETSNVEYNKGAPETLEVLNFMDSVGAAHHSALSFYIFLVQWKSLKHCALVALCRVQDL